MSYPFGELNGWPGTYWLEQIEDQEFPEKLEFPDLSNRKEMENRVEELKNEVKKLFFQKPPEKDKHKMVEFDEKFQKLNNELSFAKNELFQKISKPIAIYRAWKWKMSFN